MEFSTVKIPPCERQTPMSRSLMMFFLFFFKRRRRVSKGVQDGTSAVFREDTEYDI